MYDAIIEAIERRRDDVAALTRDLIRIPTPNPPGESYADCLAYLDGRLSAAGFETQIVRAHGSPGDSDRFPRVNLIARRAGGGPGRCVHFNSHIDVVPAGRGWTVDPYAGVERDGRIYGRGACDMKGGLAASIIAVESLIALRPAFAGAIEISATADEETGGYGGVGHLAEIGLLARPRIDHVIIPEPLDKDRICLGHRGVYWGEIETHGRIAHGSMPFLGDCAVRHMGAVLEAFEARLYPALTARSTMMPVVPEGARRSTLNINSIHGGLSEGFDGLPSPCVPDSCRLVFDRRYLIEERVEDVKAEIVAILDGLRARRPEFRYDLRDVLSFAPTMTERDAPVVLAVGAAIRAVLGREPQYVISPGTYDQKHFARSGGVLDCIAYGPGRLELAHQPDEFVVVDDLIDSAKVMALAAWSLLTADAPAAARGHSAARGSPVL